MNNIRIVDMCEYFIIKTMNQQNAVDSLVNRIISKSRKNSLDVIDCRTISEKSQRSDSCQSIDQQYIIKKSELRGFIQKMAEENYQLTCNLEEKEKECNDSKNEIQKYITQLDSYRKNKQSLEQTYLKIIQDLETNLGKEKRLRQVQQKQLNWSTKKIKEQMKAIQKFQQSSKIKQPQKPIKNTTITTVTQCQNMGLITPNKDTKRLQNLAAKNCESIQYSLLNSQVISKSNEKYAKQQPSTINTKNAKEVNQKSIKNPNNDIQISRIHRHTQIDEKDRIIKLLGRKCLILQSYIQKITKKYLGQITKTQEILNSPINAYHINLDYSKPNSSRDQNYERTSSLNRQSSEVALSSAFKVQSQL